jgi:hypothetical protein
MATMASSLFRMMNSFAAGCSACFRTRAIPPNSSRAASFPKTCDSHRPDLRHFQPSQWNLLMRKASSIPEPCQRVSCRPRFAFHAFPETFDDDYRCANSCHRSPACRLSDPDHAAISELHCRDLFDPGRAAWPRHIPVATYVAGSIWCRVSPAFAPCMEPPKVV